MWIDADIQKIYAYQLVVLAYFPPLYCFHIEPNLLSMVLCLAILLLHGNNKHVPLVVEQRGVMTKKIAFDNICKILPYINANVNNNNINNTYDDLGNNLNVRIKSYKCMYGSLILNDPNSLHLLQGHYRIILNKAVALIAISDSTNNSFEPHCLLEKVQSMIEQCYMNMSNKKDLKLSTQKRLEKLHGELLILLKRILSGYDDVHRGNFITGKTNGILGLDLSTEKKTLNKRASTSLRRGACEVSDVDNVWKRVLSSTVNSINTLHGDDPAHDIFQINFGHQFSKRKVIFKNVQGNNDNIQQNIFKSYERKKSPIDSNKKRQNLRIDDESKWKLTTENAKQYINTTFVNLKNEKTGLCPGKKAFSFFKSKINEEKLAKIYNLCNVSVNEALTPRKFGVLLHMIVLIAVKKPPLEIPEVLPQSLKKILNK
jgi:hypothetical protein